MDYSPYERILGIICSVLEAHTAVLFLPSVHGDNNAAYIPEAVFSLGQNVNEQVEIIPGQGLVGWIARNKEPLLVPNFDQGRHSLGYYNNGEDKNIKAFMGCALPNGNGVICVDSKRQYSFSEKDQKLLHLFAGLLADFYDIHRQSSTQSASLRYYAALKLIYVLRHEHSRWSDFLHSFLDIVSKASGYEYCALCTLNPDNESYAIEGENYPLLIKNSGNAQEHFSLSTGMVGWVFRNETRLSSGGPDGSPEAPLIGRTAGTQSFQSLMAIPLTIQRKVRGVLCLASELPLDIGQDVQEFAQMSAEHMALFLENLFVKCRLRDLHNTIHTDGNV